MKKRLPKKFWLPKIQANIARDRKNGQLLKKMGWRILRVWESELIKRQTRTLNKITSFCRANSPFADKN
jgi:G:T-mismatch repair DNA endonuclease (very short patch repair protein)